MRVVLGFLFALILTIPLISGCGPRLTEEDLGTVVDDMSEVPGADEPYEVPGLSIEPEPDPFEEPEEEEEEEDEV